MESLPKFSRWETSPNVSPAELNVLRALSRGLTTSMVAEMLCLSIDTVKTHSMAARYKLRAKNTTQACCEAIRRGLIP